MLRRASRLLVTPRVAVMLSGCGVADGSEIVEATSALIHLSRAGVQFQCFAPDTVAPAVNHLTFADAAHPRNPREEAARIARGACEPLSALPTQASRYAALIIPGGFGVAKHLSDYASKGARLTVTPDATNAIVGFASSKRPIGACCIGPILLAKVLPGVQVTFGGEKDDGTGRWPYADAAKAAMTCGATHIATDRADAVLVDAGRMVVTAPAFMDGAASYADVYSAVGNLVAAVLRLAGIAYDPK